MDDGTGEESDSRAEIKEKSTTLKNNRKVSEKQKEKQKKKQKRADKEIGDK